MTRRMPNTWRWRRHTERIAEGPVVRQLKWAAGLYWAIRGLLERRAIKNVNVGPEKSSGWLWIKGEMRLQAAWKQTGV